MSIYALYKIAPFSFYSVVFLSGVDISCIVQSILKQHLKFFLKLLKVG